MIVWRCSMPVAQQLKSHKFQSATLTADKAGESKRAHVRLALKKSCDSGRNLRTAKPTTARLKNVSRNCAPTDQLVFMMIESVPRSLPGFNAADR